MPPRATKAAEAAAVKPNTLVIDNGAWTIKAGLVTSSPSLDDCHVVQNCIAKDQDRKVYIGPQLDQCKDFFHLVMRRPVERGMIVNWDQERAIWHQIFLSQQSSPIKVGSGPKKSAIPCSNLVLNITI
jgi:actin-related protein 6